MRVCADRRARIAFAGTTDVGGDGNKRFSFTSTSSKSAGIDVELALSGDVYDNTSPEEEEEDEYEWILNEDVSESNYLNRCIFDRLSITDIGQTPQKTPMFLSSSIWKAEDYGDCLKRFKERAGLETDSGMDLFVLRNVVMSPFQAGPDFAKKLADTFKEVLEECLKVPSTTPFASMEPLLIITLLSSHPARRRKEHHHTADPPVRGARHRPALPRVPANFPQGEWAPTAHSGSRGAGYGAVVWIPGCEGGAPQCGV